MLLQSWYKLKKAFTKYCKKWQDNMGKKQLEKYLNSMIKYSQVLYITAGSQKILLPLYQKALWME